MNHPTDGELVPESSELLRLPRWPRDFDPVRWRPSYEDFQPSSTDKEHAKSCGKPVRVSVWDHSLTTVDQAREFRNVRAIVVVISNQSIVDMARERGLPGLCAVYDSLAPPDSEKPGAAGHAGIEGFGKETGLTKLQRRALLDDVASRAKLLEPTTGP